MAVSVALAPPRLLSNLDIPGATGMAIKNGQTARGANILPMTLASTNKKTGVLKSGFSFFPLKFRE
jgi:hypothetical protein